MRHFRSLEGLYLRETWLTIGTFDGVHLGHQEIIRKLTTGAHRVGGLAVVLTFDPHPAVVLGKRSDPFYLTTPDERASLLGHYGADVVVTFPFDKTVAATSAEDFMVMIKNHLGLNHLIIGADFALGHDRAGNFTELSRLGKILGYTVETVSPIVIDGEAVSSSRIRAALAAGDVRRANQLLGRPYQISGLVIPGDGRGHTIGIPTANLNVWDQRAIPKAGVYVSQATIAGSTWGAVTNVGFRPTFEVKTTSPQVEAHLLDFQADLYGQEMQLNFLTRLRDEQRFPDVATLVEQIHRDILSAREYLDSRPAVNYLST